MINELQKLKLEMLINNYSHAVSRFDSNPNKYSEKQVFNCSDKLSKFIESITEKEFKND